MKHTKGPWIYDVHEHSFYIFTKAETDMVADGDPDQPGIARIRGVGRGADAEEQEANAALIAAAPDLLAGCRNALVSLRAANAISVMFLSEKASDAAKAAYEHSPEIQQLLKAIAKAEGVA